MYWTRNVVIIIHAQYLSLELYYPFFTALPRRPAGIIDGTTLPGPAGLEVSFLPSTGFDIGAAARDPLFIFTPPLYAAPPMAASRFAISGR